MKDSAELEKHAAVQVAALMAAAARTAPKTRGIDNIRLIAIEDEPTRQKLAAAMRQIGKAEQRPTFERDANNVASAPAILAVGVTSNPAKLGCGFCGQSNCEALEKAGGTCAFNSIDLGIAVSSATGVASQFHVDNRIMYSVGRACLELKLLGDDVHQALGIPLSITGKNPFFDRKS